MDNVRFFFAYSGTKITMPVNPEEFIIKYGGKNETMDIVKLGEINILRKRSLAVFDFTFMLPWHEDFPYVLTKGDFKEPQHYIDFFRKAQEDCQPLQFAVSDILIDMDVSIESFEAAIQAQDDDTYIRLSLREYKKYGVLLKNTAIESPKNDTAEAQPQQVVQTPDRAATTNKEVTVGCDVTVNGRLHRDSSGNGAGQTKTDYRGKVNFIKNGHSHPYHITTPQGSWQGWVSAESVKVV